MRTLALAVVITSFVASPVRAEDVIGKQHAAARAVLDAEVAALRAGDAAAFAAQFITDEPALRTPDGTIALKRDAIEAAVKSWLGGKPTSVTLVGEPAIGTGANAAWITAELDVATKARSERLRVTEMIVGLYDYKGRAAAMMLSRAVDDKQLVGAAAALRTVATDKKGLDARVVSPALALKDLDYQDTISVIGSAPGEKAVGTAAVTKLLTAWRGLELHVIADSLHIHEDDQMMTYAIGQVTMPRKGKSPVVLDVLVIAVHDFSQDGSRPWHVDSAHYAAHVTP